MGATAALLAVLVVLVHGAPAAPGTPETPATRPVLAFLRVGEGMSADPRQGIAISFSEPMDPASVANAVRLRPAAAVTATWQAGMLTVTPRHGFAPNTAYVMTIDNAVARTAAGSRPERDIEVPFGTAGVSSPGAEVASPSSPLVRTVLTAASPGSEARVAQDGSVLVTGARSAERPGATSELVRIVSSVRTRVGPATSALSISRSGRSTAYLAGTPEQPKIAFGDSGGAPKSVVPVPAVDQGSPLGWTGDEAVSFVSGGALRSVDRAGRVRTLLSSAAQQGDTVVLAPGGRYVYVAPAGQSGTVVDLVSGRRHALVAATGRPSFSSDGATVYWATADGRSVRLNSAPSGGGPTLTAVVPDLRPGDVVGDAAISPDGTMLAYSVTGPGRAGSLRLAGWPSLKTIAESKDGVGEALHWAPNGRLLTMRAQLPSGTAIQTVQVPAGAPDDVAAASAVARAFVNAQIADDAAAQQLIAPGVSLPPRPGPVTRGTLTYVRASGSGSASVSVRLTVDPTESDPVARQATEVLDVDISGRPGTPRISAVSVTSFAPVVGPQLTHVDTRSVPGATLVSFDSDLDPRTVPGAVSLSFDGSPVAATTSYDPDTKTITVQPAAANSAGVTIAITTALRDVAGTALAQQIVVPAG